jgi:hypothetical protein
MDQHNAFVIPIFKTKVENWSEHKDRILSLLKVEEHDGHYTDYHINNELLNENKFAPYGDEVVDILRPALEEFNEIYPLNINIKLMWAQKYAAKQYHELHNHGALGFSAIFYAQFEDNHQATSFYSPYVDFIEGNVLEYVPEVSEGDIIFFPSVLMHQCKPVQSDTERIIISFNIY